MPRPAGQTSLNSAYELSYRKGFNRVGVDEIAAFARVTKRSLYYHFKSKDELLAAVFDLQHDLALARIRKYEGRYRGEPAEILGEYVLRACEVDCKARICWGWFHTHYHGARRSAWSSCACCRVLSQGSRRGLVCRDPCKGEGCLPAERAREIALLVEGAVALILIHGDRGYAEAAARAAKQLVQKRR